MVVNKAKTNLIKYLMLKKSPHKKSFKKLRITKKIFKKTLNFNQQIIDSSKCFFNYGPSKISSKSAFQAFLGQFLMGYKLTFWSLKNFPEISQLFKRFKSLFYYKYKLKNIFKLLERSTHLPGGYALLVKWKKSYFYKTVWISYLKALPLSSQLQNHETNLFSFYGSQFATTHFQSRYKTLRLVSKKNQKLPRAVFLTAILRYFHLTKDYEKLKIRTNILKKAMYLEYFFLRRKLWKNIFKPLRHKNSNKANLLVYLLSSRLITFLLYFEKFSSIKQAAQQIIHGKVQINFKTFKWPHSFLTKNDLIALPFNLAPKYANAFEFKNLIVSKRDKRFVKHLRRKYGLLKYSPKRKFKIMYFDNYFNYVKNNFSLDYVSYLEKSSKFPLIIYLRYPTSLEYIDIFGFNLEEDSQNVFLRMMAISTFKYY